MTQRAFVGSAERSFGEALIHLLETEYGLINSRKVLVQLAADVAELVDCFYPRPTHIAPGWLVYTGTRAVGGKAFPGQRAGEHELVTLAWPVLLPEDLQAMAEQSATRAQRTANLQRRVMRIVAYGLDDPGGPVLLTLADLAAMLGSNTSEVSQLLAQARQESGQALITKGYYFDQGLKPTHKAEIIALFEQGLDECAIAQQSGHAPKSVGQYLRDYQRVKLLLARATPPEEIPLLVGMQPSVVAAYVQLVAQYHPDLLAQPAAAPLAAQDVQ